MRSPESVIGRVAVQLLKTVGELPSSFLIIGPGKTKIPLHGRFVTLFLFFLTKRLRIIASVNKIN
jgi:hypothetical protein